MILSRLMRAVIFLFGLAISLNVYPQSQIAFFGEVAIPTGDFRENTKAEGYGFGIGVAIPVTKQNNVFLGGNMSYDIYGKKVSNDPSGFTVVNNNNIWMTHLAFTLIPTGAQNVTPYLGLQGGFKYFYTRTKVKEHIFSSTDDTNTELSDFVGSYGVKGGLQFTLNESASVDLELVYLKSGHAEYIDREGVKVNMNGDILVEPKKSRTDMLIFRISLIMITSLTKDVHDL